MTKPIERDYYNFYPLAPPIREYYIEVGDRQYKTNLPANLAIQCLLRAGVATKPIQKAIRGSKVMTKVFGIIKKHPNGITPDELAPLINRPRNGTSSLLVQYYRRGQLYRREDGNGNLIYYIK